MIDLQILAIDFRVPAWNILIAIPPNEFDDYEFYR